MEIDLYNKQGDFEVDVSFRGAENGITALYGPSGSGKTSIIEMVAGLRKPQKGRIVVNDVCLYDSQKKIDLKPECRRIGYVFQEARLFPHFNVKSNLLFGYKLTPNDKKFIQFEQVVEILGIAHLLNRRPAKLSGGEKQRVAIGRALLTSPSVLLMDEPLNSLDSFRKEELIHFILRLRESFTVPILYVSHSVEEIERLADQVVLIHNGKVTKFGQTENIISGLRSEISNAQKERAKSG